MHLFEPCPAHEPGSCLRTRGGGGSGALASHGRPTHPPRSENFSLGKK